MAGDNRYRVWAFIAYPEDGLNPDWLSVLRSLKVDFCVSPIHNPDSLIEYDEKDFSEDLKRKKHFHVIVSYDGKKSFESVKDELSVLGKCITRPFKVNSTSGYLRYMGHWGYSDKEQFGGSPDEVQSKFYPFGKFIDRLHEAFEIGEFDQYKVISEINNWILHTNCVEFDDLYTYAVFDKPKWAYVLDKFPCRSVHSLLASKRWKNKKSNEDYLARVGRAYLEFNSGIEGFIPDEKVEI